MFEWEGLYAIAMRFSNLLSLSKNNLVRANKVAVLVSLPRKTGY